MEKKTVKNNMKRNNNNKKSLRKENIPSIVLINSKRKKFDTKTKL